MGFGRSGKFHSVCRSRRSFVCISNIGSTSDEQAESCGFTIGITGITAVLGGVMSLLAVDNLAVGILGVTTTGLSALSAVLVAWNDHFRHRDLWLARSVTLNRLEALEFDYQSTRENGGADYAALRRRLDEILRDALREWLRIHGRDAA